MLHTVTDVLAQLRPLLATFSWLALIGLGVMLGGQIMSHLKANPLR